MAIIIPSKYIYDIDDNKVIDNEVDKLEVGAVKPNEIYDYKTIVLDSDYTNLGLYEEDSHDLKADSKYLRQSPATQPEMEYYAEVISYVNIRPAYTTITIKIPKEQADKLISKIYGKEDIKYSLALTQKEIVPIMPKVQISGSNQPTSSNISLLSWSWDYNSKRTEDISAVELKNYLSIDNPVDENTYSPVSVSANATKTLANKENLLNKEAKLNADNEWELVDLKFLTAVYVEKASYKTAISQQYSATGFPITPTTNVRTLTGEAEIYAAKQLSVTIYGDTITLDLQDETLKIGDGQHIYSFSGNELMQMSNKNTVNDTYKRVIDSWKDGKEIITLRCALADYETNEPVITSVTRVVSTSSLYVAIADNSELQVSDRFLFSNNAEAVIIQKLYNPKTQQNIFLLQITTYPTLDIPLAIGESETIKVLNRNKVGISIKNPNYPKTFKWGDIVEPYVYGANGKDKPIALKTDATPKEFKVINVGIEGGGAIFQNITCQEYKEPEKETISTQFQFTVNSAGELTTFEKELSIVPYSTSIVQVYFREKFYSKNTIDNICSVKISSKEEKKGTLSIKVEMQLTETAQQGDNTATVYVTYSRYK